jgi:ATP-dependent DNA helicase RecG
MGIVEELGNGMRKMFKYTPLYANGKEPVIEEQDVYRIEIPYIPTLRGSDADTTQKTTQKILEQIKANPYISREELAELCGLTSDGIKYNIRKLREKGIVKRVGPDKGGYWEVVED